ncbi:MAG TPA: hypothetical protein PLB38_00870 [bacterium]|nr:hypothetical protein [bacterium]
MTKTLWTTEGDQAKTTNGTVIGSYDIKHGRFQYRCFLAQLFYGQDKLSKTAYVTEIRNLCNKKELHLKSPLAKIIMKKLREDNGLKYVFPYQKASK